MGMTPKELRQRLSAPFDPGEIEWRPQTIFKDGLRALAVPYVTNRAIQNRLDDTVGIDGWRNDFSEWQKAPNAKNAQLCGISIFFSERGEWITKWDGAEDSDIEPTKGGLSDAMKRAAAQWGIGRYLYGMGTQFVDMELSKDGKPKKTIAEKETPNLNRAHEDYVAKLNKKSDGAPSVTKAEKPKQEPTPPPTQNPPVEPKPASAPEDTHPDGEFYEVMAVQVQPAANGSKNLHVQLQAANGRVTNAFVQGMDERIVPGVRLFDVVLTRKESKGIQFYTVDQYACETRFDDAA